MFAALASVLSVWQRRVYHFAPPRVCNIDRQDIKCGLSLLTGPTLGLDYPDFWSQAAQSRDKVPMGKQELSSGGRLHQLGPGFYAGT